MACTASVIAAGVFNECQAQRIATGVELDQEVS
jgi:hypothetical protein